MNELPASLTCLPLFSRADAARLGVGDRELRRAVQAGLVWRARRGWYAPVRGTDAMTGPELARHEYLARCEAIRRIYGLPLASISALAHHGLPTPPLVHREVWLEGPQSRRRPDVAVMLPFPGAAALPEGQPTVNLLEALLGAALTDPIDALAAADAATRAGLLAEADIRSALRRLGGRAGAAGARAALECVDARRESPAESRFAWLCHAWAIELTPQVRIDTDEGFARVDFLITGTRVAIEVDGRLKYRSPEDLYREKRREDALRRAGYEVVRVVWDDLLMPDRLLARVRRAMAVDRSRHGR